jgi:hypothetical protein
VTRGQRVAGLAAVLATAAITFCLQYQILKHIHATALMWLLLWSNVLIALFIQILAEGPRLKAVTGDGHCRCCKAP